MVQDSPDRKTKQGQGQRNKMKEEGKGIAIKSNKERGKSHREGIASTGLPYGISQGEKHLETTAMRQNKQTKIKNRTRTYCTTSLTSRWRCTLD